MRPNVAGFPDILSCVAADRLVRRRGIAVAQQRPKAVLSQSRRLASLWLGFPVAFFILSVMVRSIPRLAPPTLVLRDWDDTITTLKLDRDHNDSNMTSGSGDR